MANGDPPAPAADVPHFDTRFLVQTPDGATTTQVLRTDRPISTQELVGHLAAQGSTFVGYADAPPAAAPLTGTPAGAPPLPSAVEPTSGSAPTPAAAPVDTAAPVQPTAAQRAQGIFLPERSFKSQLPSIGGAVTGSTMGAAAGAMTGPFAPVAVPVLRSVGAGLGGAGGEALEIGGEKLFGTGPAEPGTAGNRILNAGIRSAGFEVATAPIQYGVQVVRSAARPITEAATALEPILTGAAAIGAKAVQAVDGSFRNINLALSSVANLTKHAWTPEAQERLLGTWWQRQAGQAPAQIAKAWDALGDAGQQAFGALRGHMQTVIDTIQSGLPIPDVKRLVLGGGGSAAGVVSGHPTAVLSAVPAVQQAVEETVPWVAGKALMTPGGSQVLANLPRVGAYVAPRLTLPLVGEVPVPYLAAAGQSYVARPGGWPSAASFNWTGGD